MDHVNIRSLSIYDVTDRTPAAAERIKPIIRLSASLNDV